MKRFFVYTLILLSSFSAFADRQFTRDFLIEVEKGNVPGHSIIHKFGKAPDFDTTDGFVTVWDGAEDGTAWESMVKSYSTTADIDSIISSSAADTVQVMEVQGVDTMTNLLIQSVTLNGQTRVAFPTNYLRVFRMKNESNLSNGGPSNLVGHVFAYVTNAPTASGVPTDTSLIRAIVDPDASQTLMAAYTIPKDCTGYMLSFYLGTAGAQRASLHVAHLKARKPGGVWQFKHASSIVTDGSSRILHPYNGALKLTEGTDVQIEMNTDVNIAAVSAGYDILLIQDGY